MRSTMYIAYYFCHISKDVGDMVRFGSYLITGSSIVTVLPLFIYLRCESKLCTSEICIHICIYLYVLHLYLLFFCICCHISNDEMLRFESKLITGSSFVIAAPASKLIILTTTSLCQHPSCIAVMMME